MRKRLKAGLVQGALEGQGLSCSGKGPLDGVILFSVVVLVTHTPTDLVKLHGAEHAHTCTHARAHMHTCACRMGGIRRELADCISDHSRSLCCSVIAGDASSG